MLGVVTDGSGVAHYTFQVTDGTSTTGTVNSTESPATSAFNYVVAWHDKTANTINIQVDGGTVASTAWTTGARNGTGPLCIGDYQDAPGSNALNGIVDELGVWGKVLTSDERLLYSDNTYPF